MRLRKQGSRWSGKNFDGQLEHSERTHEDLAVRREVENVRLCGLVRMDLLESVKQWKDLRDVLRPRGDVHLAIAFNHAVKVALSSSKQISSIMNIF